MTEPELKAIEVEAVRLTRVSPHGEYAWPRLVERLAAEVRRLHGQVEPWPPREALTNYFCRGCKTHGLVRVVGGQWSLRHLCGSMDVIVDPTEADIKAASLSRSELEARVGRPFGMTKEELDTEILAILDRDHPEGAQPDVIKEP